MGSFSDYLEDEVLDHVTGKGAYTSPTVYVALSTADPTDDASGMAEPSGDAYARVETSASDWDASSGGATANATAITFPEATGNWGTITHFALYDASTGGNMLMHGALDASRSITNGITPRFAIGELDITLD